MVDREKVISDLEEQIAWIRDNDFHKFPGWGHAVLAMRDALALLKEQEPVKPIPDTSYGARPWWFVCGNCKLSVNEDQKYCPNCGRKVKWE